MFLRCVYLVMMITSISANAQSKVARQDRYEIKQLMVPGFENLPLERKMFVYYLSEALEASRDIAWQQLSRHGLELRQLFEKIWPRIGELDAPVRQSLESYYFELIHNHGPHDGNTNEKRVMTGILPEQFVTAVVSLGAEKETAKRLLPDIFDPQLDRYRVAPAGSDKIATSGTAFYGEGMTTVLLEKLSAAEQRHFLSTPVVENEDHVRLLLHKQDGRFSSELSKAAFYLKLAKKYASPVEQELIDAHLRTIASGDPADLERAERIWVQHKPEDITFVLGFVETYDDPLEARGTWEGFILLKNTNPEAARRNQIIREHAADFEQRMPVDEEFKKKGAFTPPDSEGAFMVRFAGGSSERSFKGVNLPNSAAIREELGSHSFTAYNKVNDLGDAGEAFTAQALNEYYLPSYHELLKRYGAAMPFTLLVEFHEMLGHGSGSDRSGVFSSDALG